MSSFDATKISLGGVQLVEASAGTGKTYTIVTLYVRLLLERELAPQEILVVTYTVAATAELRTRIRERLSALELELATLEPDAAPGAPVEAGAGGVLEESDELRAYVRARVAAGHGPADRARVADALASFDLAAIHTIHGFCERVLREHAFETGGSFEADLISDQRPLLEELSRDFFATHVYDAPALLARIASKDLAPSKLAEMAALAASRPDMRVLPESVAAHEDLASLEKRWSTAHEAVALAWPGCRDEVLGLLVRSLLHKTYYPEELGEKWGPDLDAALSESAPLVSDRFPLERLTPAFLAARTNKGGQTPEHFFFDLCAELADCERALQAAANAWVLALRLDFVANARAELRRRKLDRDVVHFDDLLQRLRAALEGPGGARLAESLRQRHPAALIDEFQDTDPVQYGIFRSVWHGAARQGGDVAAFLVGDPKQAIYAFRGADVRAYLRARGDAASRHSLDVNYRSDPALVASLNALFEAHPLPFSVEGIPYEHALARPGAGDALRGDLLESGLRVLFLPRLEDEAGKAIPKTRAQLATAGAVAADVARLLDSNATIDGQPVVPGDIAILCRTNRQAADLQRRLHELGIAAVLQSDESVFATPEAEEVERFMRAMTRAGHAESLRAALAAPALGLSAGELLEIEDDPDRLDVFADRFHECGRVWIERGFVQALRRLLAVSGVRSRLLARRDGERRLTNLLHLAELIHGAAVEGRLGPLALLYWLGGRRVEAARDGHVPAEEAQLRLESDAAAVQLVTVHRSKGLQYAITYCPFAWDGRLLHNADRQLPRFHDAAGRAVVAVGADALEEGREQAEREAFEENLRLLYVGLTRARHHCTIVWGGIAEAHTSALGHLLRHTGGLEELPTPTLAKVGDEELREGLRVLAERARGGVHVKDLDPTPAAARDRSESAGVAGLLAARHAERDLSSAWRISSFSGLSAGESGDGAHATDAARRSAEEGHDYDAGSGSPRAAEAAAQPAPVLLADFPAGVVPGLLVHEIFEHLDFERAATSDLEAGVARALLQRGFAEKWREPLSAAVRDVLAAPLGDPEIDGAVSLSAVPRSSRIDEMEFVLPVASGRGPGSRAAPLTARVLAELIEQHAVDPVVRGYAARAMDLGFPPLTGYLRGFIDLVFRAGRAKRWFLVDYKSNRLGSTAADYAPGRLASAMTGHHYVLQYHLYVVALHRHLAVRLRGYDYERDFGGALYLFVRGMSPQSPGAGVFRDRPPIGLVEALSERF